MIITFLDDTIPFESKVLAIGGFIIDERYLLSLERDFKHILNESDIPIDNPNLDDVDKEVKWSPDSKSLYKKMKPDQRRKLYLSLLSSLNDHKANYIAYIIDRERTEQDEESASVEAMEELLKIVHNIAKQRSTAAQIIIDREKDDKTTKRRILQTLQIVGSIASTEGKTSIYNHAWLVDSKHHAGIQLADLAIGALGRLVAGDTKKAKAEAYWEMLRGHFIIDEYKGVIGLKIRPDQLSVSFFEKYDPERLRSDFLESGYIWDENGDSPLEDEESFHTYWYTKESEDIEESEDIDSHDGLTYDFEAGYAMPSDSLSSLDISPEELEEAELINREIPDPEPSGRRNFAVSPPRWNIIYDDPGHLHYEYEFHPDDLTLANWNFLMSNPAEWISVNRRGAKILVYLTL